MKMEGKGNRQSATSGSRAANVRAGRGPATPRPVGPSQHGPRSTSTMKPPTDPFGRPLAAPDHSYKPGSQSKAFGSPSQNINVNLSGGKNGLLGALVGGAASAAVGAIANRMETNRQEKIVEQQGKQQMLIEQQRAQNTMLLRQQENEQELELKKLDVEEAEINRDIIQDKRYYANCPYCLGINKDNEKVCPFCGMSLAYYNGDPNNAPTAYNS